MQFSKQLWALLLTASLTVMAGATVAPSLPQMTLIFSEVPKAEFLTRLILTLPALLVGLGASFVGRAVDRYGRLKLLYLGLVLYAVCGTTGLYFNDLYAILAGRAGLGIAVALTMTSIGTLIGDYYTPPEQQRVFGIQSAFMALGGMVFVSTGGFLADYHWRAPFALYGLSIVILFFVLSVLREPKKKKTSTLKSENTTSKIGTTHYFIYFIAGFAMLLFYLIPVQIPFLVKALGVESNALGGLAIVMATLGGASTSLLFKRLRARFTPQQLLPLSFFCFGLGFSVVGQTENLVVLYAAMFFSGLGFGVFMPNLNTWVLSITPEAVRGRAVGSISSAIFVGQFLTPFLAYPLQEHIGLQRGFSVIGLFLIALGLFLLLALPRLPLLGKEGK